MNDVLLVLVILITVVTVLLVLASRKTGSPRNALRRLRESGATGGIVAVVAAVLLLGTVLSFVVPSKANASQASEVQYFKYTAIFAGLDYEIGSNVFCYEGDINDKLISNVGVTQHLVGRGNVNVEAKYQHHSCALNRDKPTYDALGLNLEWRFNWK